MHDAYQFDWVAENIFAPIYPVIADDLLRRTGKKAGRMLDIGCGGGHLGLSVLRAAPQMQGILLDKCPEAVEIADRRAAQWGLRGRVVAVVGDVQSLPFPSGSIDLVVSRGSMPFWEDIRLAFSEILRVLAPDGAAYIGGGMGNRELAAQIERKMKEYDPAWPENLKRKSMGRDRAEYAALLSQLGADAQFLEDDDKGKWTLLCRRGAGEDGKEIGQA